MTAMSFVVLLTILLSSLITMLLYAFPQFLLGLILGPIVRNKFWLVEFLYRHNIARWGHLRIFDMVLRRNDGGKANNGGGVDNTSRGGDGDDIDDDENESNKRRDKNGSKARKKEGGVSGVGATIDGHSRTLHTRIVVIPNRVFVHPIPNFIDNIVYLIVCTPPREQRMTLPIVAVLIDCGEADRISRHVVAIYERYYVRDYPRRRNSDGSTSTGCGIELYGILCTHHHHDHTAGIDRLRAELISRRMKIIGRGNEEGGGGGVVSVSAGCGDGNVQDGANRGHSRRDERPSSDVYASSHGNVVVVGGAAENVPHCNLYVTNGCYVPLPCVSATVDDGRRRVANDMNALVCIEVIGTPGHTRGSVVYALRNRPAPGVVLADVSSPPRSPPQSHLFTGDVIFCGGCGVPFEADLQYRRDDYVGNPMALKRKHGSSALRPGAGAMSMERCFVEVLIRAGGAMPGGGVRGEDEIQSSQQTLTSKFWASLQSSWTLPSEAAATSRPTALLYSGHEYTTDLLMRQFDIKKIDSEIHWSKLSPSTFFEVASHYLVSAHRRGLPPDQRILTIPTALEREIVLNPNFRMLRRRGERLADALRLWYEFGSKRLIPDRNGAVANDANAMKSTVPEEQQRSYSTVFTTVYTYDLQNVANQLRSGELNASSAADQLESMHTKLDEMMIGRRPIPSTLPSHKNVYLGIVAMAMLGSAPSAMTVSDAIIMNLAPPADSADKILIYKSRVSLHEYSLLYASIFASPVLHLSFFMFDIPAYCGIGWTRHIVLQRLLVPSIRRHHPSPMARGAARLQ
jgi:glyoxylase-like metal-dependent hydrolase (beta-lactamase superfamily II)